MADFVVDSQGNVSDTRANCPSPDPVSAGSPPRPAASARGYNAKLGPLWIALVTLALFALFIGVWAGTRPDATFAPVLTVQSKDRSPVKLKCAKDTVVVAMATWCPHCKSFRDRVNQVGFEEGLSGVKLVYVFMDERAVCPEKMLAGLNFVGGRLVEDLDREHLCDPDFLDACGRADVYYETLEDDLGVTSFPMVIAADGQFKHDNARKWLETRLKP